MGIKSLGGPYRFLVFQKVACCDGSAFFKSSENLLCCTKEYLLISLGSFFREINIAPFDFLKMVIENILINY